MFFSGSQNFSNSDLYKAFNDDDLLFGLSTQREQIVRHLRAKIGKPSAILYPDDYNTAIIGIFTNDKDVVCQEDSDDYHRKLTKVPTHIREHITFWVKDLPQSNDSFRKLSITNNEFPPSLKDLTVLQRRCRRGCKAALLKPNVVKHFMLDGDNPGELLNLQEVFSPLAQNQQPIDGTRPIQHSYTSGELRFIVKNWEYMERMGLDKFICFYVNNMRVNVRIDPQASEPAEKFIIAAATVSDHPPQSMASDGVSAARQTRNVLFPHQMPQGGSARSVLTAPVTPVNELKGLSNQTHCA